MRYARSLFSQWRKLENNNLSRDISFVVFIFREGSNFGEESLKCEDTKFYIPALFHVTYKKDLS